MKKTMILLFCLLAAHDFLHAQAGWFNALTAIYPFDGNANDLIGAYSGGPAPINGVLSGPTATNDRLGVAGRALHFPGSSATNNRVTIAAAPGSKLKGQTQTITCWVKLNDTSSYSEGGYPHMLILSAKNTNPSSTYHDSYTMTYRKTDHKFYGWTNYYNSVTGSYLNERVVGSKPVLVGQWYFLAMSFNHDYLALYVNGSLTQTVAKGYDLVYDNRPVITGRTGVAGVEGFLNGDLEDIRYYNKVLGPDDIVRLYRAELSAYEIPLGRPAAPSEDPFEMHKGGIVGMIEHEASQVKSITVTDMVGRVLLKKQFESYTDKALDFELKKLNTSGIVVVTYYDEQGVKLKSDKKSVIR